VCAVRVCPHFRAYDFPLASKGLRAPRQGAKVPCVWIKVNPCEQVKPPKVDQAPTLPFTDEEYEKILKACDQLPDNYRRVGGPNAKRMKALVLLLRYSGLRVGDAVMLERSRVKNGRLFLYTQKTGVPVHMPLPVFVVEALDACPNGNPDHFFWTGDSTLHTVTNKWRQRFSKLLHLAKVTDGDMHVVDCSSAPAEAGGD
jgi:integrase/recombinase XerD